MAIILAVFVGACSSTQKKEAVSTADLSSFPQRLAADLYVENHSKSYKIKADINVVAANAVRLDLTSTLDLPLASIILTDKKIEYVLYRDKKYFSGKPTPHSLDPVFPLTVDVDSLVRILQERNTPGAECERQENLLTQCSAKTGSTTYVVKWDKRQSSGPLAGRASKVSIELPERQVSLKFYFSDWRKEQVNAAHMLALRVPEGFRRLSAPR